METIMLRSKQLLHVEPAHPVQSHPRISLLRVLWIKCLRWIDTATSHALRKAALRILWMALLALAIFIPQFSLGLLVSAMKWNGAKIPLFFALLSLTLYAKPLYRLLKQKRGAGNQNTFHGLPPGELASYLLRQGSFKRDDSMQSLGISQGQYAKIADALEKHGILIRGDNNARVLREIPLEDLVRQLRDKFPMAWSDERNCWYEKNGTFETWAIHQDFTQRKVSEETARKERKIKKLDKRIEERKSSPLLSGLYA